MAAAAGLLLANAAMVFAALTVVRVEIGNAAAAAICGGTALSSSISTVLTGLSWICVGVHSRRALPSPVCA